VDVVAYCGIAISLTEMRNPHGNRDTAHTYVTFSRSMATSDNLQNMFGKPYTQERHTSWDLLKNYGSPDIK